MTRTDIMERKKNKYEKEPSKYLQIKTIIIEKYVC